MHINKTFKFSGYNPDFLLQNKCGKISIVKEGECLMIVYYKLLDMLNRKGMTRDQLRIAIGASANTITAIYFQFWDFYDLTQPEQMI